MLYLAKEGVNRDRGTGICEEWGEGAMDVWDRDEDGGCVDFDVFCVVVVIEGILNGLETVGPSSLSSSILSGSASCSTRRLFVGDLLPRSELAEGVGSLGIFEVPAPFQRVS